MPSKRRPSKRPYGQPHEELDPDRVMAGRLGARRERGPRGEEYLVAVPRPNDKTYVCPGCTRHILGSTPHVVAWPADGLFGADVAAEQRRHWHTGCWASFGRA
jgi:hypothetical protein